MTGKIAIVCFASGDTPFESDIDFASGYLRHILGFIGVIDVTFINVDKHFMDDQPLINTSATVVALTNQLQTQTNGLVSRFRMYQSWIMRKILKIVFLNFKTITIL
jgi:hypothetical protein